MPFGDTAKKVQRVTDLAEQLYKKVNYLVEQLGELRERVESTSDQIEAMDRELAEQRAIVEALAAEQGIDVDEVIARAEADHGSVDESPDENTEAAAGETDGGGPDDTGAPDDTGGDGGADGNDGGADGNDGGTDGGTDASAGDGDRDSPDSGD